MVWSTILSQVFAAVYSYQAPDCGDIRDHFNQEVVFRFCVLMCMRPGHASIAAIILSITHAVLFVHYVPVAYTRLTHESCYAHLRTGDLQDFLKMIGILVTNSFTALLVSDQNFWSKLTFDLQKVLEHNLRFNHITQEVEITVLVVILIWAVNLIMSRLLEQSLHLQDTEVQLRAVSHILTLLCDAVVLLSPELQIAAPAPKLASLLHAAPHVAAYQGSDFSVLLQSEEDSQRLIEALNCGECCNGENSLCDDSLALQIGMGMLLASLSVLKCFIRASREWMDGGDMLWA